MGWRAARESKGPSNNIIEKEHKAIEKTERKCVTFYHFPKNTRSLNSRDRIEEMIRETEGYKWDVILINETCRPSKAEICETHQEHIFMGAGKFENKLGVGIPLNKRWRHIFLTDFISERAIVTLITDSNQSLMLMSVYFPQ